MQIFTAALTAAAILFSSSALAQAGGHQGHGGHGAPPAAPNKASQNRTRQLAHPTPLSNAVAATPAFLGYRPYRADEPVVEWKEANDLVLKIGGHVGIMKGAAAMDETPGAHAGHFRSKPAGTGPK